MFIVSGQDRKAMMLGGVRDDLWGTNAQGGPRNESGNLNVHQSDARMSVKRLSKDSVSKEFEAPGNVMCMSESEVSVKAK